LGLKVLLEDAATPEQHEQARDLARKEVEQQQHGEHEALKHALADLNRLERYERRAWARQLRAFRQFVDVACITDSTLLKVAHLAKRTQNP
jgi:hypothetical protein